MRVFGSLWLAYASYYLCRANFPVAQPGILAEFPDWSASRIGMMQSAYAFSYAVGQIIHGVLCQTFGTRRMMALAMATIGLASLAMAAADSFYLMLGLWAINGYAQSAGWPLLAQTVSDWTAPRKLGSTMGLMASCYLVGHVATWLLAGQLCAHYGWRVAFWLPGAVLLLGAAGFAVLVRNRPEDAGFTANGTAESACDLQFSGKPDDIKGIRQTLHHILTNRALWMLSAAYFSANAVRHVFINWTVQYLVDFQGIPVQRAAMTATLLPLSGAAGAFCAGWVSDRWFGCRRAPVVMILFLLLIAVSLRFATVRPGAWLETAVLLACAGFFVYGPDLLISGTATIDVSHPRAAAAATGLTMGVGAVGAMLAGVGAGYLIDAGTSGWPRLFIAVAGVTVIAMLSVIPLWKAGRTP